jgi:hypothetical protein
MKKLFDYLCVLTILLSTAGLVSAQDFTVKIPSTENYQNYIKPIKAGGTHQFQINVKNNRTDTCTVSIVKSVMGEVASWISIDNNSQEIFPAQSKNFLLTINVPASAGDHDYTLWLSFNAYDKDGFNHSFNYTPQIIIVDNSAPEFVSFSVSQKSTAVTVYSWDSWDARSSFYTGINSNSGYNGIKSYSLILRNPDGTIKASKSIDATSTLSAHKFTNLTPNTNYKASVTAIDLAGNSKTTEKLATTAPAPPTGLTFSNTTYIETTLSWNTSAGATGYDVYQLNGSSGSKRNNSPITGTSYTIDGLNPNSNYQFYVVALSNVGESDKSIDADITTLALPSIIGSDILCSGSSTFTISNLLSGYTGAWSKSSNLEFISQSGTSAVFSVVGTGSAWIGAKITAPNGRVLNLLNKDLWLGKPSFTLTGETKVGVREIGIASLDYDQYQGITNVNWTRSGAIASVIGGPIVAKFRAGSRSGMGTVYAMATNICGSEENRLLIDVTGGWYNIYPNPSSYVLNVKINRSKMSKDLKTRKVEIKIYDKMMRLKKQNIIKSDITSINVNDLQKGVYIIQLISGRKVYEEKIIISR